MIQLTLTLKMTTAQVVETSVTVNNNSPIQDYVHPDSTYFWNDSWAQTFHKCPVSFRIEPLRLFSVSLQVIFRQKQNSLGSKTSPPPPERALRRGSKTGPGKRRKSSPQTHLFMFNMQANNQSNLNTKWILTSYLITCLIMKTQWRLWISHRKRTAHLHAVTSQRHQPENRQRIVMFCEMYFKIQ